MNGNTQGTIAESQLRALAGGKYKCRTTHFSDHCHEIVDVQVELALTQYLEQIISALGGIVETDDPGYIIAEMVKNMGLRESAEGAGCNYTPQELQGLISTKEDFKETVCITTKEINRNNVVALAEQSRKMTLNIVRRLLHLMLEAMDRLHRSSYNPFYGSVDPDTVNEMYRKSFGGLNRGTACAAEVVSQAISIISTAGYQARIMVVPPSLIPRLDAGDEVALNTDYVGDNGVLSFTSPRARLAKTFRGLAVIPSTGMADDPLISHVCNPEHFVNSAVVCGSYDRSINIYNHDSGHVEPVDLRAAVDALGVFGPDGNIVEDIYDIVAEYNSTGSTNWHKDNCLNNDPLQGKTMGPLTFRNRAGELEVSRFMGHMPADRNGLQKFADSVFVNLGSRKADVIFHMRRLESILKDIHNTPGTEQYWQAVLGANANERAAGHSAEDGSYRDATGNAYGVITHPFIRDPAGQADYATNYDGYGNGPGLAYLAAVGRSTNVRQLQEIAEVYDSCEFLGNELAVVLPESQFFARRPAWFHGEYTPGMAVVDMLVPGYLNLVNTAAGPTEYTFSPYARGVPVAGAVLTFEQATRYVAQIQGELDGIPVGGNQSAVDTQAALLDIIATVPGSKDIVLPVLNRVAALVGSGGPWANVASFDVRAAQVFSAAQNQGQLAEQLHLIISMWDAWPSSTVDINMDSMDSQYVQGTLQIIQRVAAAVAQGNSPVGAPDVGEWFATTPSAQDALAILNQYPLGTGLDPNTAVGGIRLPLTVSGILARNPDLPAGVRLSRRTIPTTGNVANINDGTLYASNPVGAQFGAAQSSSTRGPTVIETVVGAVSAPVFQANYAAANGLNVASKIASRALLHTPITAGSLRALVDCAGAFYPFSFKLLRSPNYRRSESAYIIQGGSETLQVRHDPVQVIQGYDKCGSNFIANLNLSAVGLVLVPASTIKLPHFHLSDPAPGTADTSFRNDNTGYGAIIPSIVELNFRAPEELPLSGINARGELVDGSAVLMHALFDLESFAPTEHMWKTGCKASYQGKQETRDRYNNCKSLASKGPSCTA